MKHKVVLLFLVAAAFTCMSSIPPDDTKVQTSSDDWKFIGDKTVNYGIDRDVIRLGDMRDDFRQIKIRVTEAPLRIFDMKIHFDNGAVQDVALRSVIPQGGESRVIDLDGGMRHLEKIEFWYKPGAKGRRGQSRVAVWGRK